MTSAIQLLRSTRLAKPFSPLTSTRLFSTLSHDDNGKIVEKKEVVGQHTWVLKTYYNEHGKILKKEDVVEKKTIVTRTNSKKWKDDHIFNIPHPIKLIMGVVKPIIFRVIKNSYSIDETVDSVCIRMYMFHIKKEDIKISVDHNTLSVDHNTLSIMDARGGESGRFYCTMDFKKHNIDQIRATLKYGMLKIIVPKKKDEEAVEEHKEQDIESKEIKIE